VIADNTQVREIEPTEPLLPAVARIYAQMPAEWTAVRPQSIDDYSSILQVLRQSLSNADGALFAAARPEHFVTAFAWVVGLKSKERRAHLNAIWVAPDFRGKGIATLLLTRVEEKARASGITAITAHVHSLNVRMLAFALRHHFCLGYLLIEKELSNP
jgi:ribosomal protein S18 acetylase RimI-like enzyme